MPSFVLKRVIPDNPAVLNNQQVSLFVAMPQVQVSHALLSDLDYEHSGHTGFASTVELNLKVSKNSWLQVYSTQGVILSTDLPLLIDGTYQYIKYDKYIFALSIRDNTQYKYCCTDSQNNLIHLLTLNLSTGAFVITDNYIIAPEVSAHIANSDIHVTAQDKQNWNNKITASTSGEQIILTKG